MHTQTHTRTRAYFRILFNLIFVNNTKLLLCASLMTHSDPPECSSGWLKRTQGSEIGHPATVLCRVEALPYNDLSFSWSKVTKDGKERHFGETQIQIDGTTSRLSLTPDSLKDFGTLLCRAKNSVGLQQRPCQVTLVPASSPDPPFNCSSETGNGAGSLSVTCLEGFDGGFPQRFILVAIQRGKVSANITRYARYTSVCINEYI